MFVADKSRADGERICTFLCGRRVKRWGVQTPRLLQINWHLWLDFSQAMPPNAAAAGPIVAGIIYASDPWFFLWKLFVQMAASFYAKSKHFYICLSRTTPLPLKMCSVRTDEILVEAIVAILVTISPIRRIRWYSKMMTWSVTPLLIYCKCILLILTISIPHNSI